MVVVMILIRDYIILVIILPACSIVLVLFRSSCSIYFSWLFHYRWLRRPILILTGVKKGNWLWLLLLKLGPLLTPSLLLLMLIMPRLLLDWLLLLLCWSLRLQFVCSSGSVTIHQDTQSEI